MTALNLINQLLNFMAPAAFVAGLMVALGRIFALFKGSKRPLALSIWVQLAIVFVACLLAWVIALVLFGQDGKMAAYALLATVAATAQWGLLRRG